jgi:MFS family permease
MALGLTSTAVYVGLFLGPPIGGSLVTAFGWRWVFYGIVPLSLAVLLASLKLVPRRPPVAAAPFDLMGMILLIAGLPLFVMALNQSRVWGFTSPQTIFCFAAGTVLLAAFVFHEHRTEHPLLDMSLFRSRLFSGAALAAVANYMALNCTNFLIPFYFSEAAGISAGLAGAYMASQPMMMAAIAWPFGWLSDRIGSRLLTVLGMAIMTVAIAGLALASSPSSHPAITAVWLGLMGLGTGIFISPNSSALLGSAPRNRQGIASGVLAFARNLGMIFGISSAANIFASLGGVAGGDWPQTDQGAFRAALLVAAAVSLAGALTSSMRGSDRRR